ncbi:MAG: right-handed parallel beta-helix repeat-containing protein [Alphaproteobacteria bacterium]|nr:right-handed parallel beta-helix repeat-containing protein [Alphaproteobacteria bacterium]
MRLLTPLALLTSGCVISDAELEARLAEAEPCEVPATWYADGDGDGDGDPADAVVSCDVPSGYVWSAEDCDDTDPAIHPDAEERCDGVDQDCDSEVDEDAADAVTAWADADGDGYGDPADGVTACTTPSGYADNAEDCDDTDAARYPGAPELCGDGVLHDCARRSEAGLASFRSAQGVWSAVPEIAAGTAESIPDWLWPASGALYLCADAQPFYARVDVENILLARLVGVTIDDQVATLDGGGEGSVLDVDNATLEVTDLVLTGGAGEKGGALDAQGASTIHLTRVAAVDNTALDDDGKGAGLFIVESTLIARDLVLTGGHAVKGGGLYAVNAALTLDRVEIAGNVSDTLAGGLYIDDTVATVRDCVVSDNTAQDDGAGLRVVNASVLTMADCTLDANQALADDAEGGALAARTFGESATPLITITGSTFTNNGAAYGGAVHVRNARVCLVDSSFTDNVASLGELDGEGGAVFKSRPETGAAHLALVRCDFASNTPQDLFEDLTEGGVPRTLGAGFTGVIVDDGETACE